MVEWTVHHGDCLEGMRALPDASVHALVTDPPYGLSAPPDVAEVLRAWLAGEEYEHSGGGFMGAAWDAFVPGPRVWREALRVCKPGAHGIVFAGARTVDLMGIALRLAGWEVRDLGAWAQWQGFPKSLDISKELDRLAGVEREVVGSKLGRPGYAETARTGRMLPGGAGPGGNYLDVTAPATPEAIRWSGWGTGLKPAHEPWLLVRKPIEQASIARQVLATGTGALNIDGCRFAPGDAMWPGPDDGEEALRAKHASTRGLMRSQALVYSPHEVPRTGQAHSAGRFPANLVHCPKPSRAERERGCEGLAPRASAAVEHHGEGTKALNSPRAGAGRTAHEVRNHHPTVKPLRLMQWLVRLVTPPGGLVLDPFTGSGTTGMAAVGQGFRFLGYELEEAHVAIARARITAAGRQMVLPW